MQHRFIITGGGSGGHIFPAIAIADELKVRFPESHILFIGAEGKMEMEKVPKAGYRIKGLKIKGLKRSLTWKNVMFPIGLIRSLRDARKILKDFIPDIVIGVGGYASAPTVYMASILGIPTLIQEQNSYAGLSNRWLAKKVNKICVAYDGMERFFDSEKIRMTGNPVRGDLQGNVDRSKALKFYDLQEDKPTILIFGGSLGARAFNNAMQQGAVLIDQNKDVQFVWQIGKIYSSKFLSTKTAQLSNVRAIEFLDRMDLAYSCADLVICRAGALTIAELEATGKPAILVPSPNVAEDHQTANANALLKAEAAIMIREEQVENELLTTALDLIHDKGMLEKLSKKIKQRARPNATKQIVNEIIDLLK